MAIHIRRREFIFTLGGAAVAWPLPARAQQPQRVRRIGVFMPGVADDPEYEARNAAFLQGLGELGWIVGRNVRIEYRWGAGDAERYPAIAAELVGSAPEHRFGGWTVSRSRRTWLRAWRVQEAMPPDLSPPNLALAESGWSCSRRSRRA